MQSSTAGGNRPRSRSREGQERRLLSWDAGWSRGCAGGGSERRIGPPLLTKGPRKRALGVLRKRAAKGAYSKGPWCFRRGRSYSHNSCCVVVRGARIGRDEAEADQCRDRCKVPGDANRCHRCPCHHGHRDSNAAGLPGWEPRRCESVTSVLDREGHSVVDRVERVLGQLLRGLDLAVPG
jgi:hypothetical protein